MTELSLPWAGTTLGDCGPYDNDEWSRAWAALLSAKATDGPLIGTGVSPDIGLSVTATVIASASVDVSTGAAIVDGTVYINDAAVNLPIAANVSGNPRIDRIVLRKTWATQTIRLAVIQGTPAPSPSLPSLIRTAGVTWEETLAYVAVANGFVTIVKANITPDRHFANAPSGIYLLDVLNNSGGLLETGDVVVWDTTADRAVKSSTTLGDPNVAGVWVGANGAGVYGRVLVSGIGYVRTTGAIAARGTPLVQSATAKQAVGGAGVQFATSLEITTGAGQCLCYINADTRREMDYATHNRGSNTTTSSTNWADIDTTNLGITSIIKTGRAKVTMSFPAGCSNGAGDNLYLDIACDGVNAGDVNYGLYRIAQGFGVSGLTMIAVFEGLTPGSHTFRARWRVNQGTATGTAYLDAGAANANQGSMQVLCVEER